MQTGDLGNTVHQTAHAGIIVSPHNYLEEDPSSQSSQMVRLVYNTSTGDSFVEEVLQFGGQTATGLYNLTAAKPDYYAYEGDVNTRKFPYDPTDPYDESASLTSLFPFLYPSLPPFLFLLLTLFQYSCRYRLDGQTERLHQ